MKNLTSGQKFYNGDLKKRYITECSKDLHVNYSYIEKCFSMTAEYEEDYGKDLCDWTVYEITEYYKMLNVTSLEILLTRNSLFSMYTQFCLENNLVNDNQNHYLECKKEVLNGCINKAMLSKMIVDRETVLSWVEELPNARDQFIILSLFEYGTSKEFRDIVNAKPEDISGNKLKLSNRTVDISDELIEVVEDCINQQEYFSISETYKKVTILNDYGYILKSYPNQKRDSSSYQKGRNVYQACQRIFKYLDIGDWMSANAIAESGKLSMIKEKAAELNMTPVDYIFSDNLKEVEKQFDSNIVRSIYVEKYKEYLV